MRPKNSILFTHEREKRILELLADNSKMRISDLSDLLCVSQATIRRDIDKLHQSGLAQRVHGGVRCVEQASPEPPVILRKSEFVKEKSLIGRVAANLIQEGDTVFIGSGTTAMEVARNLIGRQNITVITNALTVINLLIQEGGISLVSIGGLTRSSELSFIGYITEQALRELRPKKVFMGIRAISLSAGLTNDFLPEVTTDRVIIQSGSEIILLADHSKFGKISVGFVAPIQAIHKLITDNEAPEESIKEIRSMGIEVIQV